MKSKSTIAIVTLAMLMAGVLAMLETTADALQEESRAAEEARSSFVVIIDAAPITEYDGGVNDLEATITDNGERPDPRSDAVKEYRRHLTRIQNRVISSLDLKPKSIINRYHYAIVGFSAMLTEAEATTLSRNDNVILVERDRLLELAQQATGPQPDGPVAAPDTNQTPEHTGEGVVVGVIDTGIWPEHPMFSDDGSYEGRPETWTSQACAFGSDTYNPEDVAFECNNKLVGARNLRNTYTELLGAEAYASARDYTGHGTQVAGVIAGSPAPATILDKEAGIASGVAPRAHVAAYAACGSLGCYASDVIAAVDRAVADGVDVINFAAVGGSEPLTAVGLAFLRATTAGVSFATAAGNAGPSGATVGEPATYPWVTTVGAADQSVGFEAAVTISGERYVGVSVADETDEMPVIDAATRSNPRCDPTVEFEPALDGEIVVCARGAVERVAKSRAVFDQGGGGMIVFNQTNAQSLIAESHWVPTIHLSHRDGRAIRAALAEADESPTTRIESAKESASNEVKVPPYSSRGPNPASGDILKPDVIAPGTNVLTATTPTSIRGQNGELFETASGSSVATAHVAGTMALIREDQPQWSPAAVKSALMTTATRNVTADERRAGAFTQGSGLVSSEGPAADTALDPGVILDVNPTDYQAYLCEVASNLVDTATCEERADEGEAVNAEEINLPSVAIEPMTGSVTVTRALTNVIDETLEFTSFVQAADGVSIEVDTNNLTLDAGESGAFDITISVDDEERLNGWVSGSIVWETESGDYRAHLPVVARPVSLDAPDVVAGEEGETELEVAFGYDGEYELTTHGLVSPQLISGQVSQDVTPTASRPGFDVSDAEEGAGAHEIELSDTAHLRLALTSDDLTTPEQTDPTEVDLDLYLYDEEGNQVASSIAGTSAETIDVSFPADGTYTLYVHGWSTQTDQVEYEMRSWTVPRGNDDSLEVTEAPTFVSTGATENVQLSWDVTSEEPLLGVVSHHSSEERLGVTLIEVPATE